MTAAVALTSTHEGRLAGEGVIAAEIDGVGLDVALRAGRGGPVVSAARHRGGGTDETRGVLDMFCRVIEGLPLQEAADHGAQHVVDRLPDRRAAVAGILIPHNAGPPFALAERLIRRVRDQVAGTAAAATINFWNPPLSAGWVDREPAAQAAAAAAMAADYCRATGLPEDAVVVIRVERHLRVIVAAGATLPAATRPRMLLGLERWLQNVADNRLEVFIEEMKDQNAIRRL